MLAVLFSDILPILSYITVYFFLILVGKYVYSRCLPYELEQAMGSDDNPAVSVSIAGYVVGLSIIFLASIMGPSYGLVQDVKTLLIYVMLGLMLLNISAWINDKILLNKFSHNKEIYTDKNVGLGAVQFGNYIASACVIAGSIYGEGGGLLSLLFCFFLGQVGLSIVLTSYKWVIPYDTEKELEADNVAVGISLAGSFISFGIFLMKGLSGDFLGFFAHSIKFASYSLLAILFFIIVRFVFDRIILMGMSLNDELSQDRNEGLAFLEAVSMVCFSVVSYCFL